MTESTAAKLPPINWVPPNRAMAPDKANTAKQNCRHNHVACAKRQGLEDTL